MKTDNVSLPIDAWELVSNQIKIIQSQRRTIEELTARLYGYETNCEAKQRVQEKTIQFVPKHR